MLPLKHYLRKLRHTGWIMTAVILVLLCMGVLFVYSACYISEKRPVQQLYLRQVMWCILGMGVYLAAIAIDYRKLSRLSWWFYSGVLALLVLVLLIGSTVYGAKRWLMLFGSIGIQPAELAKLAMVMVLAVRLDRPARELEDPRTFISLLVVIALPVFLILKQPDLGTALVFVPSAFVMMFVAGVPLRFLGVLVALAGVTVLLLLSALFLPARLGADDALQARFRGLSMLHDHQIRRIEVFFHPEMDPLGAGWNKRQSEIAVGSGGVSGKGFKQGTQNILGFLPRSVAPTDFIFAVIAEEKGFVGAVMVIGLFAVLIVCTVHAAVVACDRVGRLICVGVVSLIFCHVFINIAMTVGLMPITGLPLPLLSYGGSFMAVMLGGLGLVQNVRITARMQETYQ